MALLGDPQATAPGRGVAGQSHGTVMETPQAVARGIATTAEISVAVGVRGNGRVAAARHNPAELGRHLRFRKAGPPAGERALAVLTALAQLLPEAACSSCT